MSRSVTKSPLNAAASRGRSYSIAGFIPSLLLGLPDAQQGRLEINPSDNRPKMSQFSREAHEQDSPSFDEYGPSFRRLPGRHCAVCILRYSPFEVSLYELQLPLISLAT